ncbi:hypothetical protein PV371_36705 [Streptomyces sp. TX20-6-3]|uniref:hypothetical protein n=1 Tax=Streptomyces sp. TX20-6-3 TaxID=3028705 RepID=UPI0029A08BA3|nr:hypothetical protein [Streptomyces sp. TX20-6-3]MDX2565166.1 hypothetical protein [Streptomyces sp. TX20-6-3]
MYVQQAFRLDDLSQVRLAARRAGNPFFDRVETDGSYTRTVFAGRGLLFLARPVRSRPHWRVHLAFFAPLEEAAWLVLLSYHQPHHGPAAAQEAAENLAAQMHRTSWHQAVGLFARPARIRRDQAIPLP